MIPKIPIISKEKVPARLPISGCSDEKNLLLRVKCAFFNTLALRTQGGLKMLQKDFISLQDQKSTGREQKDEIFESVL
jgi:hypothetical protein